MIHVTIFVFYYDVFSTIKGAYSSRIVGEQFVEAIRSKLTSYKSIEVNTSQAAQTHKHIWILKASRYHM